MVDDGDEHQHDHHEHTRMVEIVVGRFPAGTRFLGRPPRGRCRGEGRRSEERCGVGSVAVARGELEGCAGAPFDGTFVRYTRAVAWYAGRAALIYIRSYRR